MKKNVVKIKKIIKADPERFRISLIFNDGRKGTVDLSDIFNRREEIVEEILRGNLFSSCYIESGALAWPNGLELCPYSLRANLVQPRKSSRARVETV